MALLASRLVKISSGISSAISSFNQSISSEVEGFFFKPYFSYVEENLHGLFHQVLLHRWEMHVNNLLHGFSIREINKVEEAAAQECIRQLFLIVRGNDHDGAVLSLDGLTQLVNVEFHSVNLLQQIVGKFDIGFVDFINQQHDPLFRLEGLPKLAFFDVVADVVYPIITKLRIPQTGYCVVLI